MFINTRKSVTSNAILTNRDIIRTFSYNQIHKPSGHNFRFDEETDPASHDEHEAKEEN